jgi:anti-sigma-K factor RskA
MNGDSMSTEEHVIDLLPAYVLDILTGAEKNQVVEHLAGCQKCLAELRTYQLAKDELAFASKLFSPRPQVKTGLIRKVRFLQKQAAASSRNSPWRRGIDLFIRSLPVWGLALIVVLALVNWVLWTQLHKVNLSNPTPLRVVALASTENAPGAIGSLVMSQNGEYGTLIVDKLDDLDTDHQYQLWLIKDGQRSSGGVFSVNPDGYASLVIYGPQPLNNYQAVGITIEPAGGSPQPTGMKVLGGEF